jgi:glutathione transport system permease protein
MVLPATTLGLAGAGLVARVTRGSLIDALNKDYVLLLVARGVSPTRIFWRHALRNALIPVVTILGLRIGWVIGGAVPVEVVFARPGIGSLLVESIGRRDYPVVQATLLLLAVCVMLGSLLADLLQAWIDPRVRRDPA